MDYFTRWNVLRRSYLLTEKNVVENGACRVFLSGGEYGITYFLKSLIGIPTKINFSVYSDYLCLEEKGTSQSDTAVIPVRSITRVGFGRSRSIMVLILAFAAFFLAALFFANRGSEFAIFANICIGIILLITFFLLKRTYIYWFCADGSCGALALRGSLFSQIKMTEEDAKEICGIIISQIRRGT